MKLSREISAAASIALVLTFSVTGTQFLAMVDAQQANISQQSPLNFSGSIPLANSLIDVLKSKIKVSLLEAMNNVTNSLGPNTTLLSGSIQPEVGFLTYNIAALDSNNTIHMVIVDPGNGTILSQQEMPAVMSRILSPPVGPQLSDIPNLEVP